MNIQTLNKTLCFLGLLCLCVAPQALAQTSVKTDITANADTGNQTQEGGSITTGSAKSSIEVETIINGETVESFEKTVEEQDGGAVIEYQNEVNVNSTTGTIEGNEELKTPEKLLDISTVSAESSSATPTNAEQVVNSDQPSEPESLMTRIASWIKSTFRSIIKSFQEFFT